MRDDEDLAAAETLADSGEHVQAPRFSLGAILGKRYEIVDEIGRGGHGAVFRARDRHADQDVALKIILDARGEDLALMRRELAMARKVSHPGVVRMYDLVEIEGGWALSMELIEGGTSLATEIDRGPMARDRLVVVARALAEALAAAHDAGVTHRDLKPQNILVRIDGKPVITDFGISRVHGANVPAGRAPEQPGLTLTSDGALLGTPLYMAPEQLEGRSAIGPATDVYAFGLIMFEAATGREAHRAANVAELLTLRTTEAPPSIDAERPGLPRRLTSAIDRCLARDPADRFPDGGALLDALQGHVRGPAPSTRSPGSLAKLSTQPRRRRLAAVVLLGGAALVAGAVALAIVKRPPKEAPPTAASASAAASGASSASARDALSLAPRNARRMTFGPSCEEYPSFFPDGKRLVFDLTEGKLSHLFVLDVESGKTEQLTASPGWDFAAEVSPTGDHVLFLRSTAQVGGTHLLRVGAPEDVRLVADGYVRPTFLPDGKSAWVGDLARPIRVSVPDGGKLEELSPPDGWLAARVLQLPDGRLAGLFGPVDGTERDAVAFAEPRNGKEQWSWATDQGLGDAFAMSPGGQALLLSRRLPSLRTELIALSTAGGPVSSLASTAIAPANGMDVSADGRRIAWSTCRSEGSFSRVVAGKAEAVVSGGEWQDRDAALLSDTRASVISDRDGSRNKLWITDLASPSSPIVEAPTLGTPHRVAASADGAHIVAATDRGLVLVDASGKTPPRMLTEDPFDDHPSFDHQSRIVFARRARDGAVSIYRVPLEGGEAAPVGPARGTVPCASPTGERIIYLDTTPEGALPMIHDGTSAKPLSSELVRGSFDRPQFSRDGRTAIVVRDGSEIAFIDVEKGKLIRTQTTDSFKVLRPLLASSGELFVVQEQWIGDIWVADL